MDTRNQHYYGHEPFEPIVHTSLGKNRCEAWCTIVENYSESSLTDDADKLVTLSGLHRYMAASPGDDLLKACGVEIWTLNCYGT